MFQHGTDMASCADAPASASCQKAINERDVIGLALATGGVALLPGGAQAMWGLGAAANAGMQQVNDGEINPVNFNISGWVNRPGKDNGREIMENATGSASAAI